MASPERSRRESMGLIAPFLTQDNVLHWYTAVTKHAPLTKSEIFALLWLRTLFEYSRAVKLEDRMNAFVVLRKELGHSWSKVKDDACRIALMAAVVGLPVANIAVAASTDFVVPEEYQRPTLDLEERYQILSGFCEEYGCPTGKLSVDCFIGDNPNDELVPRALKQLMGLLTSWLDVHECFPTIPYEPLDKANIVNLLRSTIADESVSDEAIKSVYRLVQWEETVLHGCGTDGLDWDYRMAIQEIIANSAAVDLCNRLSATLNRAQSQLSQTSVLSLVDAAWPELCHRAISTATRDNLSAVFSACSIISTSLQAVNADLLLSSRWDILAFLLSSALLMVDSHANSAASLLVNTLHRVELGEYELDFEGAVSDFKECDPVTVAKLSIFILGWRCGSRPSLGLGPCDALDEFFGVVVKECLSQSIARTAPVGDGSLIKQYLSGCISCRDALRDVLPDQSLLILKPFSIATLVQVVKSLLELRNFQSALVVLLVVIPLAVAVDPSRVLDPNIDNQLDALHQLTEHEDGLVRLLAHVVTVSSL